MAAPRVRTKQVKVFVVDADNKPLLPTTPKRVNDLSNWVENEIPGPQG